jgi:molybdenum cofactor cytidylyltransferase
MINAIVLAAGESKRMGMPKSLLQFGTTGGITFLGQIVSVLKQSRVDRTTVVLGAQSQRIQTALDLSGTDVVLNENYCDGQLSSLIVGLKSLPSVVEAILLCLVDNPFIAVCVVDEVVSAFRLMGRSIVTPVFEGERGHPTLFARELFGQLLAAPADKGARHTVYSNEDKIFEVPVSEPGIRFRINTPEEYLSHFGIAPRIFER